MVMCFKQTTELRLYGTTNETSEEAAGWMDTGVIGGLHDISFSSGIHKSHNAYALGTSDPSRLAARQKSERTHNSCSKDQKRHPLWKQEADHGMYP